LRKTAWVVPSAVALLVSLAPAVWAGERGASPRGAGALQLQPQGEAKPQGTMGGQGKADGKGEAKGGGRYAPDENLLYTNVDYSKSHLESDWYMPFCDFPWMRVYPWNERYGFVRERRPPDRTLEFFCVPVTTHLLYPELYPRQYHAGGTVNVDY
jgi:hypothetical protein